MGKRDLLGSKREFGTPGCKPLDLHLRLGLRLRRGRRRQKLLLRGARRLEGLLGSL